MTRTTLQFLQSYFLNERGSNFSNRSEGGNWWNKIKFYWANVYSHLSDNSRCWVMIIRISSYVSWSISIAFTISSATNVISNVTRRIRHFIGPIRPHVIAVRSPPICLWFSVQAFHSLLLPPVENTTTPRIIFGKFFYEILNFSSNKKKKIKNISFSGFFSTGKIPSWSRSTNTSRYSEHFFHPSSSYNKLVNFSNLFYLIKAWVKTKQIQT